ncbi:MAG: ATP-binding protein [Bryobacteraceae bacterium]
MTTLLTSRMYVKVLAWLLVTILITSAGFLWVTARGDNTGAGPPYRRLMAAELEQLRRLHETGDRARMQEELRTFRDTGLEVAFTDHAGRDLTGPGDYSELIGRLEHRIVRRAPILHRGRLYWAIESADERYWLVFESPRRGTGWLFTAVRANLWIIASLALLSLWLAHHITSPIRRLRAVMESFGQGNLAARAGSGRGDEIGDLARSFDQMATRLERLVTSQRRLLADLSHELRTPLTRLGLAVELARSGGGEPAPLDRIQKEADRLNDLVGGLLQVTRGESDPAAIEMTPLPLDELAAEIVEESRLEANTAGIELNAEPVTVRGNAELLRRAIENVLRNAIRYSPHGEAVTVEVRDGTVAIRDRGPGVPAETLPLLFDAFYRVKNEHEAAPRGFGLGLSIARRAVELHGGTIRAENARPGLRVAISLAAAAPAPAPPRRSARPT